MAEDEKDQQNSAKDGVPGGMLSLRERIKQEKERRRQEKANQDPDPFGDAATDGEGDDGGACSPGAAGPSFRPLGGEGVSLQDIVNQRRDKLQKNLSSDPEDVPAQAAPEQHDDIRSARSRPAERGGPAEAAGAGRARPMPAPAPTKGPPAKPKVPGGKAKGGAKAAASLRGAKPIASPRAAKPGAARQAVAVGLGAAGARRLKLTYGILVANTFLLAVLGGAVLYTLSNPWARPTSADAAMTAVKVVEKQRQKAAATTAPAGTAADANSTPKAVAAAVGAPSWSAAAAAFKAGKYNEALDCYGRLLLASRQVPADALCADFFQYRIAQSLLNLGRTDQGRTLLRKLTHSDSPLVRAASNARLARMDLLAGQYLQACVLAYRALGALKAMEESLPLEADCDYVVARALTEKVNTFHSTDQAVPWSRLSMSDVFAGRDETETRRLLSAGSSGPGRSGGAPEVRITRTSRDWTLICSKAALEDVLHQFAVRIGKDVRWDSVAPAVRRRSVSFAFRGVSEQRACELLCGMSGLLGGFTWDQIVVHDPESITSLVQQRQLLTAEALSAWRRFALRFADDNRVPESHFARAALFEWSDSKEDKVAAMKQYQLIGRQYRHEQELAPGALMRSARIRMGLLDYPGAASDLQDLLDLYPRFPRTDEVYLWLGKVRMQAGLRETARKERTQHYKAARNDFQKVYDLNASRESRAEACLEMGNCYLRQEQYKEASKWLSRYIGGAAEGSAAQMTRAYLLLGNSESAQGNHAAAAGAYRRVLESKPSRHEYVEGVLALTKSLTELGDFVGAMAAIRRIEAEQLTEDQKYRYLMAGSRVYRSMGLPDRARASLRKPGGVISDPHVVAMIAVERARCLREAGDLRAARQGMSEALVRLKGGPDAWGVSLELGEICMTMGDPEEAIVFASEVRAPKYPAEVRRRALEMLGRAYLRCNEYAQATEALAELAALEPSTQPATQPATRPAQSKGKSQ